MFQGHGDDGYLHGQSIKADFSTNVWHGGAPEGLKEYLFNAWDKVQRYPEVLAESLTLKISAHYALSEQHILVTNGSTESIYLIAQAFRNKRSVIAVPAFAEYEDACKMHGHELGFIDWADLKAGRFPAADLLFVCNPNNPTGDILEQLENLVAAHKSTLFVVDEAFIEFTLSLSSVLALVTIYSNLIVMRSMTKVYAIPGLRLGYIAAHPDLTARLRAVKLPWTVNVMAMEAGHFIFDNLPALKFPVRQLLNDKEDFTRELEKRSLIIYPSHTHFFLAETMLHNAEDLKKFLLREFNLLIRDAGNFRTLGEKHIRIATLNPAKNQLLLKALDAWILT